MQSLGNKSNHASYTMGVKHNRAPHTMGTKTNTVIRYGNVGGFTQESGLDKNDNLDPYDPVGEKPSKGNSKKSNLEK